MHNIETITKIRTNLCAFMHRLDWSDLQFVLAVAETGSMAGASRRLNVHHATVLRRIGSLEKQLGIRLFERSASGYQLTAESTHVLSTVRDINERIEGLQRAILTQDDAITGSLRLTTTDSLSAGVVHELAWTFCRKYPSIHLELLSRNDHLDFARLEADLTIRPAPSLPDELSGTRVCDMGLKVYGHRDYLRQLDYSDPSSIKWLGLSPPLSSASFGQWVQQNVSDHQIAMTADTFVSLLPGVKAGIGVSVLPCLLADHEPELEPFPLVKESFSVGVWVATHRDLVNSPKIQMAASFFADELIKRRQLIEG